MGAQQNQKRSLYAILIILIVVTSLITAGLVANSVNQNSNSNKIADLQTQVGNIQQQIQLLNENVSRLEATPSATPIIIDSQNDTLQNLTNAINQIQNQLSELQQQINNQPEPTSINQEISTLQSQINSMQSTLSTLQQQIAQLQASSTPSVTYQNITYVTGEGVSLAQLFEQVKGSIVVVRGQLRQVDFLGRVYYTQIQGSGFVYSHSGTLVILTNNHVVSGTTNITATFTDGQTYGMTILGSSAATDFAVLTSATTLTGYQPLQIISSSTVKVGDPVVVVGTPYGLAGSMSNGIISATNRTLTTSTNTEITNIIQTTAPLNPGNSGGPVMNYLGQVIGIATAIVEESQGIGFAVPSNSILTELQRIMP